MDDNDRMQLLEWWPELLESIAAERPLDSEYVTIAEVQSSGRNDHRHLYTALVSPSLIDAVLTRPGAIGHEVTFDPPAGELDRPSFSVWAADIAPRGLEPLVAAWESNLQIVFWPDSAFLATYGLVPRWGLSNGLRRIEWDDPQRPVLSVIISQPVSIYASLEPADAWVKVRTEYIKDYATRRGCHLVQVLFQQRFGEASGQTEVLLKTHGDFSFDAPGRRVDVRSAEFAGYPVLAKVWLVRPLVAPGEKPVLDARYEYDKLLWPGYDIPVDDQADWFEAPYWVFVRDVVLREYEGRAEFSVNPMSGSVSCGGQWAVGPSMRVGRDLIAVELKKLYEGTPPEVVRLWHEHSVAPPAERVQDLARHPNVATRTKRVVYALCLLGERLGELRFRLDGRVTSSSELVGVTRASLDYSGWWSTQDAAAASWPAPLTMTAEEFLGRASRLSKLVIEPLAEGHFRRLLLLMGDTSDLGELRSIKLLGKIVAACASSRDRGLEIPRDYETIALGLDGNAVAQTIYALVLLNELRTLSAHRSGRDAMREGLERALEGLRLSPDLVRGGWGAALDRLYDVLAEGIEAAADTLGDFLENRDR